MFPPPTNMKCVKQTQIASLTKYITARNRFTNIYSLLKRIHFIDNGKVTTQCSVHIWRVLCGTISETLDRVV